MEPSQNQSPTSTPQTPGDTSIENGQSSEGIAEPQALPPQTQAAIENWGKPSSSHVEVNQQAVFTQEMMPVAKKRSRLPLVLAILLLGTALAGLISWLIISSQKTDYQLVFNTAMQNALSTKNFQSQTKQDYQASETDTENITKYDLGDTNALKSYMQISGYSGADYTLESYIELEQSYYRITQKEGSKATKLPQTIIGKWAASNPDPKYSSSDYSVVTSLPYVILDEVIVGNFSDVDRQQLLDFMLENQVYVFNEQNVTSQKAGSQETLVYEVNINQEKLIELNKTTGQMLGAKQDTVQAVVNRKLSEKPKKAQIFIDASTKTVNKVYFEYEAFSKTTEYGNFLTTALPEKPKSQLTEEEFFKFIENWLSENQDQDLSGDELEALSRDTERKSDMRAIQSKLAEFYALNGRYPISLGDIALGLEENNCRAPGGNGTCAKPDYTYKAFKASTDTSSFNTFASSSAAKADATITDSDHYILYTNSMEAQSGGEKFYIVSSNF